MRPPLQQSGLSRSCNGVPDEIPRRRRLRPGQAAEVVEIDVAPPRAGEALVRITHIGVCHTDAFTLSGDDPEGLFPAVLGHEGAGVVVEVGEGVTSLQPGDHLSTRPNAANR